MDNEIYTKLYEAAKVDGIISDDEYFMLQQVRIHGAVFLDTLKKAREDGIIDESEATQLTTLRKEIMSRAEMIMNSDENISEDEHTLISSLAEILSKYDFTA